MNRDNLIASFEKRYTDLAVEYPWLEDNEVMVACFHSLVHMLIDSGQPEPQVGISDRQLDCRWLVNGECVAVIVFPQGWILFVEDAKYHLLLHDKGDLGEDPPVADVRRVQGILRWMGSWEDTSRHPLQPPRSLA